MPKSIKIFAKVGSQFCQILNSYSRNCCQTLYIISPNPATLRLTLINGSFLLRRGRDNGSAFARVPSVRFKKNASTSFEPKKVVSARFVAYSKQNKIFLKKLLHEVIL